MTTILFDSTRVNPAPKPFAAGISDPWPLYHSSPAEPLPVTDADDPTDYVEPFHPTPEDDAFNAATSPLNRDDDELTDADWFAYEPLPSDWAEYETWCCANGQFGHTREEA